jgi:hypothetical protein
MFRQLQSKIGENWCRLMHESLTWPAHGHYQCLTCGRRYPAFPEAAVARPMETASIAGGLLPRRLSGTAWLSRA